VAPIDDGICDCPFFRRNDLVSSITSDNVRPLNSNVVCFFSVVESTVGTDRRTE